MTSPMRERSSRPAQLSHGVSPFVNIFATGAPNVKRALMTAGVDSAAAHAEHALHDTVALDLDDDLFLAHLFADLLG